MSKYRRRLDPLGGEHGEVERRVVRQDLAFEQAGQVGVAQSHHVEDEDRAAPGVEDLYQPGLRAQRVQPGLVRLRLADRPPAVLGDRQPRRLGRELRPGHGLEVDRHGGRQARDHFPGALRVVDQLDLDVQLLEQLFGIGRAGLGQAGGYLGAHALDHRPIERVQAVQPVYLEHLTAPAEPAPRRAHSADRGADGVLLRPERAGADRRGRRRHGHLAARPRLIRDFLGSGGAFWRCSAAHASLWYHRPSICSAAWPSIAQPQKRHLSPETTWSTTASEIGAVRPGGAVA